MPLPLECMRPMVASGRCVGSVGAGREERGGAVSGAGGARERVASFFGRVRVGACPSTAGHASAPTWWSSHSAVAWRLRRGLAEHEPGSAGRRRGEGQAAGRRIGGAGQGGAGTAGGCPFAALTPRPCEGVIGRAPRGRASAPALGGPSRRRRRARLPDGKSSSNSPSTLAFPARDPGTGTARPCPPAQGVGGRVVDLADRVRARARSGDTHTRTLALRRVG